MARITRGDAQAVFEAFGGGGRAILQHSGEAEGAPADFLGTHGAIRPFAPWDGRHFCADDWHVIVIADVEGGDASFKKQDAEDVISRLTIGFVLDGVPLPTTRTAVKRFHDPGQFNLDEAYYVQQGRLMAPADLAVGPHRLECQMTLDGQPVFQNTINFVVDASGTGACIHP